MNQWRASRLKSFINAFSGIWSNLRNEPNFLIQTTVAVLVIAAGFIFSLNRGEWMMISFSIGAVLTTEAMNTAVEKICDRFTEEKDPMVRRIKDSSAAAVLIISLASAIVGLLVFLPHVKKLF